MNQNMKNNELQVTANKSQLPTLRDEDKIAFAKELLSFMQTCYNRDLGVSGVEVWLNYFVGKYSLDDFVASLRIYGEQTDIQGKRLPAPAPADILHIIKGCANPSLHAWESVVLSVERFGRFTSIKFDDNKTMNVIKRLGGWDALCAGMNKEYTEVTKIKFMNEYQSIRSSMDLLATPFPSFYGNDKGYINIRVAENGRAYSKWVSTHTNDEEKAIPQLTNRMKLSELLAQEKGN